MILLLLLLSLSFAQNCSFTKGSVYTYAKVKDCLNSLKLDTSFNEKNKTLNTILTLLDSHAGLDSYLAPAAPFQSLAVDLKAEIKKLYSLETDSVEEFYSAIQSVFKKAKDNTLAITKPCGHRFTFALPYAFKAVPTKTSPFINLYFIELPTKYYRVTTKYESDQGISLVNRKVLGFSWTNDSTSFVRPDKFIRDWADQEVFSSKSSADRFTTALKVDFSIRNLKYHSIPQSSTLYVKYNTSSGAKIAPLVFYVYAESTTPTMETSCGILGGSNSSQLSFDASSDENLLFDAAPETEASTKVIPDSELLSLLKSDSSSSRSNADSPYDVELIPFQTNHDINFYYCSYITPPTVYLRLSRFHTTTPTYPEYIATFIEGFKKMQKLNVTRLIVDVRGNPGGNPTLTMHLLNYIQPSLFPMFPALDVRESSLYTELENKGILTPLSVYEPLTADPITSSWYTKGVSRSFPTPSGGNTRATYSKKYYRMISEEERYFEQDLELLMANDSHITFDPQHLIFLTDGLCGSTCTAMLHRVVEGHIGKVIYTGRMIEEEPKEELSPSDYPVGAYPYASYKDTAWFGTIRNTTSNMKFKQIPESFVRGDVVMRWGFEEAFSFDYANPNTPMAFSSVHPDVVVPYWNTVDERFDAYLAAEFLDDYVFAEFEKCASWQVLYNPSCDSHIPKNSHMLYGHPCDDTTSDYDTSKCVFARCETGYFRNQKNQCVAIPVTVRAYKFFWWIIPIASLFVLCLVFITIVIVYNLWKGKAERTKYTPIPSASKSDEFPDSA